MHGLTFQKTVDFEDVFSVWQANEGSDPVWQRFATEEKGWDSWEAWRQYQMNLYPLVEREWSIYAIDDPNIVIPNFRVGPYKGFQQHFEKKHVHTFADLVRVAPEWVANNIGVQTRAANFPQGTQFIGLYIKRNDTFLLVEGHHRAAAIAMLVAQKTPISFETSPTIAIATIEGDEFPMLDHVLHTSSDNPLS